jgi:hypothetical protein
MYDINLEATEFFLYFPTKEGAEEAARHLKKEGFNVEIEPDSIGSKWLCLAMKVISEDSEFEAVEQNLETLAERLHGEFDGWGGLTE